MGIKLLQSLFLFVTILLAGFAAASVPGNVDSCQILNVSGTYTLTTDIISNSTCFSIVAGNITFNGQGHTIRSEGISGSGILVVGSSQVSVLNVDLQGFSEGVLVSNSDFTSLSNIHSNGSSNSGIIMIYSSYSNITNIVSTSGGNNGISLINSNFNSLNSLTSNNNHAGFYIYRSNNNVLSDITAITNGTLGFYISYSSGNYFVNLNSLANENYGSTIFDDGNGINYIQYSNANGLIHFTGNLNNWNVPAKTRVSFPGSINIEYNNASVYGNSLPQFNKSMNITLYNVPPNLVNPQIIKNGAVCQDCYNFTSLNAGTVIFSVSSAGSYSLNGSFSSGSVPLVSCQTFSSSGTYLLNQDISSNSTCFVINASNVILDGQGHSITYSPSFGLPTGVIFNNGVVHSTVKNLNVIRYANGIDLTSGTAENIVENVTIVKAIYGLHLVFSDRNNISSLTLVNNSLLYMQFSSQNILSNILINPKGTFASASLGGGVLLQSSHNNIISNLNMKYTSNGLEIYNSLNNNLTNISSNSTLSHGLFLSSSNNTLLNKLSTSNSVFGGIYLAHNSNHNIFSNVISTGNIQGIYIFNSHKNLITNLTTNLNYNGTMITSSSNNSIINLNSAFNSESQILDNGNLTNFVNYLNENGKIEFTSKITNWSVKSHNVSFPGTINISFNRAVVDPVGISEFNKSANITFYNLPTNIINPRIFKNGVICNECRNFTSLNAGTVIFNVSSAGTYNINGSLPNGSSLALSFVQPSVFESQLTSGDINSCQVISSAGTYKLTQNIFSNGTCFTINSNDVILDGQGYNITLNNVASNTNGIVINATSRNVIRNIHIYNYARGVSISSGLDNNLSNIFVSNSTNGILITLSNRTSLTDIKSVASSGTGITVSGYRNSLTNVESLRSKGFAFSIISNSGSFANLIAANTTSSPGPGVGFDISSSTNNTFTHLHNYNSTNIGITIYGNSNHNVFNDIVSIRSSGISMISSTNNTYNGVLSILSFGTGISFSSVTNSRAINLTSINSSVNGLSFSNVNYTNLSGLYVYNSSLGISFTGFGNFISNLKSVQSVNNGIYISGNNNSVINAENLGSNKFGITIYGSSNVYRNLATVNVSSVPGVGIDAMGNNNVFSNLSNYNSTNTGISVLGNNNTIANFLSVISGDGISVTLSNGNNTGTNLKSISSKGYGMNIAGVINGQFTNITLINSTLGGISLGFSHYTKLTNVTINGNPGYGTTVPTSGNTVFDSSNQGPQVSTLTPRPVAPIVINGPGYAIGINSNHTIITNLEVYNNSQGIIFNPGVFNNTIINLNVYRNELYNIADLSTRNNSLIYSNSFGKLEFLNNINWSISKLRNLSFPGNINLASNYVYWDSSLIELNRSAKITLYNMPGNLANPQIIKNGVVCTDCYNFTSLNAGTVIFNVSSAGTYLIQGAAGTTFAATSAQQSDVKISVDYRYNLKIFGRYILPLNLVASNVKVVARDSSGKSVFSSVTNSRGQIPVQKVSDRSLNLSIYSNDKASRLLHSQNLSLTGNSTNLDIRILNK